MKIIVSIKQVPDTSGKVAVNPDGTLNRASMQLSLIHISTAAAASRVIFFVRFMDILFCSFSDACRMAASF